jgi:hypothetical protein
MRATYPAVDGLVRVSAGVARDLAGYLVVPPEKLPVIYNPVLTSHQLGILPAEPRHPWLAPGQPPFERAVADYRVAASAHTYLDALGISCPISVGVTAAVPDHD